VQSLGAEDCGPNTSNVTVPVGLAPPDNVEPIAPSLITEPATPLAGAETDVAVELTTVVEVIAGPQPLIDGPLPPSPP
jgi:hypothetical protein